MSFVESAQQRKTFKIEATSITIKTPDGNVFVTKDDIIGSLHDKGYVEGVRLSEIDLNDLEQDLAGIPEIESAQVFRTIDGQLNIELIQRQPIVRVLHANGMSHYLDDKGKYMPLSPKYTARVLLVNGNINESTYRKGVSEMDQAARDTLMQDEIYQLADYIYQKPFLRSQIVQVYLNEQKEFELIPRVGDHRIVFGDITDLERKFKKLEIFYKEGLPSVGWNSYDTINLKFRNQIVCTKK